MVTINANAKERTMINYKYNDGGRAATGRKGKTGDCVTRAIATLVAHVTGRPPADVYNEVYKVMADLNLEFGGSRTARAGIRLSGKYRKRFNSVLESRWGIVQMKQPRGGWLTFTEAYNRHGDCIVKTTKHLGAVIDGEYNDTFDCRTYEWENEWGEIETRQRKAASIWVINRKPTRRT